MIPKIIHYVWVGDAPKPPEVLDCIESWRRMCQGWEIREWGSDFAKSVECRYVQEALAHRKWAFASDWIRLHALSKFGGFYLDTDMEMRKPFDCFLGEKFVISWERMNGRTNLNCGVIGSEPGGEVVDGLLKVYDGLPFVKADGELDLTPNTVRLLDYFKTRWNVSPADGTDTVRFGDGGVIFPCTHFLPESGYTFHRYAATWLDAWVRKMWLKVGPYKLVRFKRRKEVAPDASLTLLDGERQVFSFRMGGRKRIVVVRTEGDHGK